MYKCVSGNPLGINPTQVFVKGQPLEESVLLKDVATEEIVIISCEEFENYFD